MAILDPTITDDLEEITKLGYHYLHDYPDLYPDDFIHTAMARFGNFFEYDEFLPLLYRAVYYQQVYGTSLIEFSAFRFDNKNHEERKQYITWDSRFLYMAFLNRTSDCHILDNKYEAYILLKPFYRREAMLLSDETDYEAFCEFVKRTPAIFVKPNNLELAEGAHRLIFREGDSLRDTFEVLLKEAASISSTEVKRKIDHRLILEEMIVPSAFTKQLNPDEMSLVRVTTVYIKGTVHFFYPCLRLLYGNGQDRCGEDYSYVALIDSDSGEVVTSGKGGILGDSEVNPITGQSIKGIVLPDWEALKDMLIQAAELLPTIRYIGWDVAHTDKGWCIIEGNTNGEFFYQMCIDRGLKEEFENLIGFKVPYDFWKSPLFQKKKNTHDETQ